MAQGSQAVGDRAFRRELDDHETRITEVEESGGGGGGGRDVTYEGGGNEETNPTVIEIGDGIVFRPQPDGKIILERGSGVLDRFSLTDQIGFAEGEDGTIGELFFEAPELSASNDLSVLIHCILTLSAEEEDVVFGNEQMGLGIYDEEDNRQQDLMYVAPTIKGGGVPTTVMLDFLIQPDKFYGGEPWRVRPFIASSPGDLLVLPDKGDLAGVAASFGVAHLL